MQLYFREIQCAAQHGTCPPRLWTALRTVARSWHADVRENERINKMIALQGSRCPGIGIDLPSARCVTKHFLGRALGGDGGNARYSERIKVAEEASSAIALPRSRFVMHPELKPQFHHGLPYRVMVGAVVVFV